MGRRRAPHHDPRLLRPHPPGLVHATFNRGTEPVEVLAIITPLTAEGPVAVEVADQEP